MNFDMAKDLAEVEDIEVRQVVAGEDVASSPKGRENKRRSIAESIMFIRLPGQRRRPCCRWRRLNVWLKKPVIM